MFSWLDVLNYIKEMGIGIYCRGQIITLKSYRKYLPAFPLSAKYLQYTKPPSLYLYRYNHNFPNMLNM